MYKTAFLANLRLDIRSRCSSKRRQNGRLLKLTCQNIQNNGIIVLLEKLLSVLKKMYLANACKKSQRRTPAKISKLPPSWLLGIDLPLYRFWCQQKKFRQFFGQFFRVWQNIYIFPYITTTNTARFLNFLRVKVCTCQWQKKTKVKEKKRVHKKTIRYSKKARNKD